MRICFIGDGLIAGVGDPRVLGWVGRVNASLDFDVPATFLTLAVSPRQPSRWPPLGGRGLPRLAADGGPHGLVIGIGPGDVPAGISTAFAPPNLANITDRATSTNIPSFVVVPRPWPASTPVPSKRWPPPVPGVRAAGSPSSTATHLVARRWFRL